MIAIGVAHRKPVRLLLLVRVRMWVPLLVLIRVHLMLGHWIRFSHIRSVLLSIDAFPSEDYPEYQRTHDSNADIEQARVDPLSVFTQARTDVLVDVSTDLTHIGAVWEFGEERNMNVQSVTQVQCRVHLTV